jgi:hypothetical protein
MWCCEKAELEALREAVDETLLALGSEVTAPLIIDDGGAAREVIKTSRDRLKSVRRVA